MAIDAIAALLGITFLFKERNTAILRKIAEFVFFCGAAAIQLHQMCNSICDIILSGFQDVRVSVCQGFSASTCKGVRVPGCQGSRVSN